MQASPSVELELVCFGARGEQSQRTPELLEDRQVGLKEGGRRYIYAKSSGTWPPSVQMSVSKARLSHFDCEYEDEVSG